MNAGFSCEQPEWLVALFAAVCALEGFWWFRGRRAGGLRAIVTGAIGVVTVGGCAVVVGALLVHLGTSGALGLLGFLALMAAGWLTVRLYRRGWGHLSPLSRVGLVGLRLLAVALVLMVLGRPVWKWVEVEWQKPLLVALLDQSDSMAIADIEGGGQHRTRADAANDKLRAARGAIGRLDDLYEVRRCGLGIGDEAPAGWRIEPRAPISPLAEALRAADQMRSRHGAWPAAVLVIGDGAENVATERAARAAAAELATGGTALLAVGVGPAPGEAPLVELESLVLPAQLGLRDRLRVPVVARVQGCAGATVGVEVWWNSQRAERTPVRIDYDIQHIEQGFDLLPPEAGVHRLTARVTLPKALGGQSFETSAVVDVRDERVRVLCVEDTPRTESAFVGRALQADAQLELNQRFLFAGNGQPGDPLGGQPLAWSDYDVVVLGRIRGGLPDEVLEELAEAVTERGVGLLLAGGRALLNDVDRSHTPLAVLSPVTLVVDEFGLAGPVQFTPTMPGWQHAILRGAGEALPVNETPTTQPDERRVWLGLPSLGSGALLGDPKPVAVVLARDARGRPLLAAQEVGRGRCVVAAWESTWSWALASDEGAALHKRLWRQLVLWLANRRPHAWVLTDRPRYPLAALTSGQDRVRIRAGLVGAPGLADTTSSAAEARLELVFGSERQVVLLGRAGEEWVGELPTPDGGVALTEAGQYVLELSVQNVSVAAASSDGDGAVTGAGGDALRARSGFAVVQTELEHLPPTSNLRLLRALGEQTAAHGGGYWAVEELPGLLQRLAESDRRQEVRRPVRYCPNEREPWVLLVALVVALGAEWALRKRLGLS